MNSYLDGKLSPQHQCPRERHYAPSVSGVPQLVSLSRSASVWLAHTGTRGKNGGRNCPSWPGSRRTDWICGVFMMSVRSSRCCKYKYIYTCHSARYGVAWVQGVVEGNTGVQDSVGATGDNTGQHRGGYRVTQGGDRVTQGRVRVKTGVQGNTVEGTG